MMTFERFDDINHLPLRVFNRAVFLVNILSQSGKTAAEEYLKLFDEGEKKQIYIINAYIKQKGYDFVRKEVTNGLEIVDEEVHG